MVTRVSTYTTSSAIFNQTQRLQVNYAQASQQASSGLKAQGYQGISHDTQRLLAFESDLSTLNAQTVAIKAANLRINEMFNVTNTIQETLAEVGAFLTTVDERD
jgi:hypothetical protein